MVIRIINRADVRRALPMAQCIGQMRAAMRAVQAGDVTMPGRQVIPLADGSGFLGMMPGSCRAPATHGLKVLSILPANPQRGLPALQGVILLFDPVTGAPAALIDAAEVTAIRTAAVSALATRYLARADAQVLALFGCGVQAASHLEAIRAVRPISRVIVWGRTPASAERFCAGQAAHSDCTLEVASSAQAAARAADIICTVTAAAEPVLHGAWLRPGTHVNLVGSHDAQHREADAALIARGSLFVDYRAFAETQAGEIVAAIAEGLIDRNHIRAELGALAQADCVARATREEITVFKSLGLVAQDLFAAELLLRNAAAAVLGSACEF